MMVVLTYIYTVKWLNQVTDLSIIFTCIFFVVTKFKLYPFSNLKQKYSDHVAIYYFWLILYLLMTSSQSSVSLLTSGKYYSDFCFYKFDPFRLYIWVFIFLCLAYIAWYNVPYPARVSFSLKA